MVLEQIHRWPEAQEHFGRSAELARSAGNLAGLGRALTYRRQPPEIGSPDRALEVLQEAHAALSRTKHRADLAHAEGAIGMAHLAAGPGTAPCLAGDLTAVRELHSSALAVGERRGNHELRLTSLRLLAATARAAGDQDEALSRLDEALGCALSTGGRTMAFEAHRDLADFHRAAGADPAARYHLRTAPAVAEQAAPPELDEVRAALAGMPREPA